MASKTISITIPEQLERELQLCADDIGVSRSRFIGDILLNWQSKRNTEPNDCINHKNGWCRAFSIACNAPQSEAETCSDYKK